MREKIKIRKAVTQDLDELVKLCKAHADFESCSYHTVGKAALLMENLFCSNPALNCLVVELNGELMGYSTFMKQFSTWDACFYVYLDCIYLKENARGLGIGKQLMQDVQAYAKEEACTEIQWQTPDFNADAIEFYQKLGATSKSKERFFWAV